jgi:hypothetical protein
MSTPDNTISSPAVGGPRGRSNPAPRRALSRFSPAAADDSVTPAAAPVPVDRTEHGEASPSPAAAPGGTAGRDLLIPTSNSSRGKNGRAVPSLSDLMPPAAPAGRRSGGNHGHQQKRSAKPATDSGGKDAKLVEVVVRLPKPVRKKLKARATEVGMSPEQAVARLVEVWLEE